MGETDREGHEFAGAAGNGSTSLPCPVPTNPVQQNQRCPPDQVRLYGAGAAKELRADADQALTGAALLVVLSV